MKLLLLPYFICAVVLAIPLLVLLMVTLLLLYPIAEILEVWENKEFAGWHTYIETVAKMIGGLR